jgi:hypothetical protein
MIKNIRFISSRQLILFFIIILTSSCSPQPEPTPFRPPTLIPPTQPLPTTTTVPTIFTEIPTQQIISSTATESVCTNVLSFLDDVTVEDGTTFSPNTSIDKQWLVKNDGTCDWDSTYQLKWVGGDPMGANTEQPLFPARAGSQATLRILFTAPTIAGDYESAWQAVDSNGNFFGDLIFIKIVVAIP